MSSKSVDVLEKGKEPEYVSWHSKLLAELALSRIPGLVDRTKHPDRATSRPKVRLSGRYREGILLRGSQSLLFGEVPRFHGDGGTNEDWDWRLDAKIVRRARECQSPFVLFLFDADTDKGRFLRLTRFPAPSQGMLKIPIRLPVENTINKESLESMIATLQNHRGS